MMNTDNNPQIENEPPKNSNKFLKIILIVLAVIVAIYIVGTVLGTNEPENNNGQSNVNQSNETADSFQSSEETKSSETTLTFGLNETATFENIKVTSTDFKSSDGSDYFKPDTNKTFVGASFEIENISDKDETISSMLLFDSYVDDVKCEYSVNANLAFANGTLDGTLAPGKKLKGVYAIEVPDNWKTVELQIKSSWLSNEKATFVFNN